MAEYESCNHNCGECGSDCAERTEPQSFLEKPHPESNIKKVIGIVSGKGGVGKSLVTSLLASAMQQKGKNAAVLDADITGPSIPKMFGIQRQVNEDGTVSIPAVTETGIKIVSVNMFLQNDSAPVIWRGPVISGVVKQFWTDVIWDDVDYMFVDMPPGTGDVPLTVFQSLPVDGIVVVTSPQELVGMVVRKAVNMAEMLNIPILGIVENMAYFECPSCHERHAIFGESHVEELAKEHGIQAVAQIPLDPQIASLCDAGQAEKINCDWIEPIIAGMPG